MDESSGMASQDCHEYATCSNNNGGFTCTCDTGFIGDGTVCILGLFFYIQIIPRSKGFAKIFLQFVQFLVNRLYLQTNIVIRITNIIAKIYFVLCKCINQNIEARKIL